MEYQYSDRSTEDQYGDRPTEDQDSDDESIRRMIYGRFRDEWIAAINEGPHTSFKMVEVLMSVLQINPRTFLKDPTRLTDFEPTWVNDVSLNTTYSSTWSSYSGRCTSFAVRVADRLVRWQDENLSERNYFDFQFYNLGTHRVARCSRHGLVIDSESRKAVEVLPNNAEWTSTPNQERGCWKFRDGHSVFEDRSGRSAQNNTTRRVWPITAAEAMGICLHEVAQKAILICLFRSIPNNTQGPNSQNRGTRPEYHGVVRWRLEKQRIELTPNLDNRDAYSTITFGGGTKATNVACARNLVAFIKACGIEQQWKADGVDQFNRELWKAAVLEWGYPVWKE